MVVASEVVVDRSSKPFKSKLKITHDHNEETDWRWPKLETGIEMSMRDAAQEFLPVMFLFANVLC